MLIYVGNKQICKNGLKTYELYGTVWKIKMEHGNKLEIGWMNGNPMNKQEKAWGTMNNIKTKDGDWT
jgi:radical SAM superfamily enzyme YgiQ (UPF0313 family)